GVQLVRLHFPQYAPFVRFVRDINPETLRVPVAQIYEILLKSPESIRLTEARKQFADNIEAWAVLGPHLTSAGAPNDDPVRGVMLFGIGEWARARKAVECLRNEDMLEFGRLMNISHEGERCFQVSDDLAATSFQTPISDAYLRERIDDLASDDPGRV